MKILQCGGVWSVVV